jgi:malate dehydrogenase (oxaloacetate-decarboxylating)
MDINKKSIEEHAKLKGKIATVSKVRLDSKEKLSIFYTPGVGAVSSLIANDSTKARDYTWINNNLAVISDGSAVLGLGNIGPLASLPVMEGKAVLFKEFANIDAVPIILDVHTAKEIADVIEAISLSFGAINLEDIAAPICFEVEDLLKERLSIPVMHDDQHGTAVVVLSGLINATKLKNKPLSDCEIVIIGAGSAGTAVAKLIHKYAHPQITVVDSRGIIHSARTDLNKQKIELASFNMKSYSKFDLSEALSGADIVIGLSKENMLTKEDIKSMAKNPIVFVLANPNPEINPNDAIEAGALVVATGRSDYPNQVNNVIAFPGIFRGAIDNHVKQITDDHKIAAAEAIASLTPNPTTDQIITDVFNKDLVPAIARVIT